MTVAAMRLAKIEDATSLGRFLHVRLGIAEV